MMTEIKDAIIGAVGKATLACKEHGPEIFLVGGIVGVIAGTVLACRATTKLGDIMDDTKQKLDEVHDSTPIVVQETNVSVTSSDKAKNLCKVYLYFGARIVKLYWLPVTIEALSIAAIAKSHSDLRSENLGLATACLGLTKSLQEIQSRSREALGEDAANKILYGIEDETYTEETTNENGEKVVVEKTKKVITGGRYNPYIRIFGEDCIGWDPDPNLTLQYLKLQRTYFDDLLKARGYLVLNDVLVPMGFQATREGQYLGWKYDPKNEKLHNYIDFGIYDANKDGIQAYLDGRTSELILEFNCDGDIMNLVWPEEGERCTFDVR